MVGSEMVVATQSSWSPLYFAGTGMLSQSQLLFRGGHVTGYGTPIGGKYLQRVHRVVINMLLGPCNLWLLRLTAALIGGRAFAVGKFVSTR